ncbi:MAG: nucleoside-diphosphate sugar epimerase/dehydratase [Candidatus Caldarchaeum sp.]
MARTLSLWKNRLLLVLGDALIVGLSLYLAFLIRFEGRIPLASFRNLGVLIPIALALKLPIFYLFRLYRMSLAYVSFAELFDVFKAVTLGSIALGTVFFLWASQTAILPRSVLILDYFITLFLIGGFRSAQRIYQGWRGSFFREGRRVLIVGAGNAGEQIVRAMLQEKRSHYFPVGFIDDDPAKQGMTIHGVRVLGRRQEIPQVVQQHAIEELLIAMPSVSSKVIRETVELGRQAGLKSIKVLPGFHELVTGRVSLTDIREVQLEDLLGREPVRIDVCEIKAYLKDKVVLVTGAAGSIGSELCRQIAKFRPRLLIALDQDETGLFALDNALREKFSHLSLSSVIADIQDKAKIEQVFGRYHPQVVFHAAAYKHVPLMEAHPDEAVKNNIFGTITVAEAAQQHGCEKFVLISTDKAVNPSSVMGATKRVAEMVLQSMNSQSSTKFISVRFGNVLGSRGSVIPIFQEQIKRGGPVTVTHHEMRRYFMVTSEAVLLVLQAGALGQGGEVFVLDMGDPVRIVDLAREMIRLSGYEPDRDIPIVFVGPRPGEKLFEELLTAEEGTVATKYDKIFMARTSISIDPQLLRKHLQHLKKLTEQGACDEIIRALQEIVPTYKPSHNLPEN